VNATPIVAGGSTGSLGGVLLVYLGQRLSWNLTPTDGAAIVAGLTAVVAFVAHNGLVGIWHMVWRGNPQPNVPQAPPTVLAPPPPLPPPAPPVQ